MNPKEERRSQSRNIPDQTLPIMFKCGHEEVITVTGTYTIEVLVEKLIKAKMMECAECFGRRFTQRG